MSINIRKAKREENLQKRRNLNPMDKVDNAINQGEKPCISKLHEYVIAMRSTDAAANTTGTVAIRKLLSVDRSPPAAEIISAGVVNDLVRLLMVRYIIIIIIYIYIYMYMCIRLIITMNYNLKLLGL